MPTTYTVIAPVTGLAEGQTITDDELDKKHPGLGGVQRLLDLKAIREGASEPEEGEGGDVERVPADRRSDLATGNTASDRVKRGR